MFPFVSLRHAIELMDEDRRMTAGWKLSLTHVIAIDSFDLEHPLPSKEILVPED